MEESLSERVINSKVKINTKTEALKLSTIVDNPEFPTIFNASISETRKKIKKSIPPQMVLYFSDLFNNALRMGTNEKDHRYDFEKILMENFREYKSMWIKKEKSLKQISRKVEAVNIHLRKFISQIQYVHNSCNIIFDVLNSVGKYQRNPMVNFKAELEIIKQNDLIDNELYELFKQFNDFRNMMLHEDGLALLIQINVEELNNLIYLTRYAEFGALSLLKIYSEKIRESLRGIHDGLDNHLDAIVDDYQLRLVNSYGKGLEYLVNKYKKPKEVLNVMV